MVKTSVKYEMKYIKLPPSFHSITFCDWLRLTLQCWGVTPEAGHGMFSVKVSFHVLYILWIETLISVVTEETRRYLFNAYEPFNFDFVLKKTLVITTNLTNPESAPAIWSNLLWLSKMLMLMKDHEYSSLYQV